MLSWFWVFDPTFWVFMPQPTPECPQSTSFLCHVLRCQTCQSAKLLTHIRGFQSGHVETLHDSPDPSISQISAGSRCLWEYIAEIQELTNTQAWLYVETSENPADELTEKSTVWYYQIAIGSRDLHSCSCHWMNDQCTLLYRRAMMSTFYLVIAVTSPAPILPDG